MSVIIVLIVVFLLGAFVLVRYVYQARIRARRSKKEVQELLRKIKSESHPEWHRNKTSGYKK